MGNKSSVKSKSAHLAVKQQRMLQGDVIEWQGEGIYLLNPTFTVYHRVTDIKTLEFAMKGDKTPHFVREDDLDK